MTRIIGAVLAGGRSTRFGSDKALALLEGRRLIDWTIGGLRAATDEIVLCGRPSDTIAWVADRPAPDLGPLGGLNAALHYGRSQGFDAVLSVPCDAPLLPPDLRARLQAAGDCAFLADMPVIGLWPTGLADRLDAHLADGGSRSMRHWASVAGATACATDWEAINLNTRGDLDALEARRRARRPL